MALPTIYKNVEPDFHVRIAEGIPQERGISFTLSCLTNTTDPQFVFDTSRQAFEPIAEAVFMPELYPDLFALLAEADEERAAGLSELWLE